MLSQDYILKKAYFLYLKIKFGSLCRSVLKKSIESENRPISAKLCANASIYKQRKFNYPNSAFRSSTAEISSKYFALILFDTNEFLSILNPLKSVTLMKIKL